MNKMQIYIHYTKSVNITVKKYIPITKTSIEIDKKDEKTKPHDCAVTTSRESASPLSTRR